MGLFDLSIKEELNTKKSKDEILNSLKEKGVINKQEFKSSILKYELDMDLEKSNTGYTLNINGELQQFYVLILFVLIIFSILVTYGIGVVFVVAFAYFQRQTTTKFIKSLIS